MLATVASGFADAVYSALAGGDDGITSITYTAMWDAIEYSVTYHLADGSWAAANIADAGASAPDAAVAYDAEASVALRLADTVVRAGYALAGWQDAETAPAATYLFASGATGFSMPAADVDLYPVWAEKLYKVSFDGNAPSTDAALTLANVPADQPVSPAELHWADDVDAHAPTFTGYEFLGWTVYNMNDEVVGATAATASPLAGATYAFSALANNNDADANAELKLVANWQIALIYNVLFVDGVDHTNVDATDVTAGTMPADQTSIAYTAVVDDHAPSRMGYTFSGWAVEDVTDVTAPVTLASVAAADASTAIYHALANENESTTTLQLTALWTANLLYNVHFLPGDNAARPADMGTLADLTNIGWDDTFLAGPAPTRAGYTFTSWAVTNTTDAANTKSIGKANAEDANGNAVYYAYHDLAYDAASGLQDEAITDVTLTALWEANKHTVTYVIDATDTTWAKANITDAGASTPDAPVTYGVDDTVNVRQANTAVRAGYTLIAWYDDSAAANTYVLGTNDSFVMDDFDVVLNPVWEAKLYTVTFDGNKPAAATDAVQTVTGMPTNPQANLLWTDTVATDNPTLTGYVFAGWAIQNAASTGANTAALMNASYAFNELALTDTDDHSTLNLVAQWTPAPYRVTYVDPFDANGVAISTPTTVTTNATILWAGSVSDADPWSIYGTSYAGKSSADWRFDGWQVLDANTSTYVAVDDASLVYSVLAGMQGLTVADVATDADTPALLLYATWTRRIPFIVDYVKLPVSAGGTADAGTQVADLPSTTLVGLDGDDIATAWASQVLALGNARTILGYTFNSASSQPGLVGTLGTSQLGSGNELHLTLYYDQLLDYTVTYVGNDGKGGVLRSDMTSTQTTALSPAWDTPTNGFAPDDSVWFYRGYVLDHWTYGAKGDEYTFIASSSITFSDIAEAIYGELDGTEGRSDDRPVTLYAVWVERSDYKVVYNDNYSTGIDNNGIVEKFLDRIPDLDDPYTPGNTEEVTYSSNGILPADAEAEKIVAPGVTNDVNDGSLALYRLVGWNYSATGDGNNQKPAEGMTFQQIVEDMLASQSDPAFDPDSITLYARWEEIPMEIKYTPVLVVLDENGEYVEVVGGQGGGTVSRTSETIDRAITWTADESGATMVTRGATVTPNAGYHFVGWRRVSDGEIVYANGWDPASLAAQALTDGNVMPSGVEDGSTLFVLTQNATDGYWHSEEYQALFAQNDTVVLHYDKNADDATGTVADQEGPYGTTVDLSDGSPLSRNYYTLTGWNTEPDGTGTAYALGQTGFELPEGGDTLYAQWQKNQATLTYATEGDDVSGMPANVTDEWGTTHEVPSDEPTRPHYVFKGWNTEPDGTGTAYAPGDGVEIPGDGMTLYAQWELEKYEVSVADSAEYTGGTVSVAGDSTIEIEYGSYLPNGYYTATPEDGYTLKGWKYRMQDENGNWIEGTVDDPSELLITGPVEFTPIFEKDTTSTSDDDNGEDIDAGDDNNNGSDDDNNSNNGSDSNNSGNKSTKGNSSKKSNTSTSTSTNASASGSSASTGSSTAGTLATTGDQLTWVMGLAFVALAAAALALIAALALRRRKEEEEA